MHGFYDRIYVYSFYIKFIFLIPTLDLTDLLIHPQYHLQAYSPID
jgi:hypothetical protein